MPRKCKEVRAMGSADLTRINTNIQALNALNALNNVNTKMSVHQLRLATGKKINSAADDAAGFTIASKLNVKAKGLGTALDNIASAKNLMTVSEGHLTNIQDILSQMKSKAMQAANGTLGEDERNAILAELEEFNGQINAEVDQAKWAGTSLLSDSTMYFQIGVGTASADALTFNVVGNVDGVSGFTASDLGVTASSTSSASVSASSLSTIGMDATFSTATVFSSTSSIAELDNGHYNVEASFTTGGTVTIQVFDSEGSNVLIDTDGADGDGSGYTLTTSVTEGDLDAIDLGVGISIDIGTIDTASAGSAIFSVDYTQGGNTVGTQGGAQDFMDAIDTAIDYVSDGLSYIGSQVNRLSFQENSLTVAKTNTEAAYSRIVDADMAWEQLESTKLMILQQTATSMLAQANMGPQSVLSLFG